LPRRFAPGCRSCASATACGRSPTRRSVSRSLWNAGIGLGLRSSLHQVHVGLRTPLGPESEEAAVRRWLATCSDVAGRDRADASVAAMTRPDLSEMASVFRKDAPEQIRPGSERQRDLHALSHACALSACGPAGADPPIVPP
jgi:hypothetical protein